MTSPEPPSAPPVELDDIAHIIDRYRHAKYALDNAQELVDQLRGMIEDRMGASESGLIGGREVVRWRHVTARRLDQTAVKEYLGTKYDEFLSVTFSRRFTIEVPGGAA
jgi:hypothetical protein